MKSKMAGWGLGLACLVAFPAAGLAACANVACTNDWAGDWSGDESGKAKTQERSLMVDAMPGKGVRVRAQNGGISIVKAEGGGAASVQIKAIVRARTDERLAATKVTATRDGDGLLSVGVEWPDEKRKGNEGVSFEITLPEAVGVDAETSNGNIRISGLSGEAKLETSNGLIVVDGHDGGVVASSSNGNITIEKTSGAIEAETSNGGITVRDAPTSVKADTSNGNIRVGMLASAVGPVLLDTSNGGIELDIGAAFAGVLRADTSNAGVDLDVPAGLKVVKRTRSEAEITFAPTGKNSVLDTSNGQIKIRQR